MAPSTLDPVTQAFSVFRKEHAGQSGEAPSISSLNTIQDFLTAVSAAAIEDLGTRLVSRVGWTEPASDRFRPEVKDLWVALVDPMDVSQTVPLRQAFVRIGRRGQLEAGVMSIVAEDILPHEDVQQELRAKCPEIFKMVARRRKGKQTAESWSLDWCEPLMARSGTTSNVNDWLSLTTSLKTQKLRCISVSRDFATLDVGLAQLTTEIRKTIGRLSTLLEAPPSEQLSEKLIQPGDAFVSTLAALDNGRMTQADTDALLGVIRDVLKRGGFPDIVVRATFGDQSAKDMSIEIALPGRQKAGAAPSRAGIQLFGGERQIAFSVEQRHQYARKKFGGRTAVAEMHQARRRTQNGMSVLDGHGFEIEQHMLDIEETLIEKVKLIKVIARRVFDADGMKNDQMTIAALIEMVRVFHQLSGSQVV